MPPGTRKRYQLMLRHKGLCIQGGDGICPGAGTGKSTLVNKLRERLMEDETNAVFTLAYTNVAAVKIHGRTLHSMLQLTKNNRLKPSFCQYLQMEHPNKVFWFIVDEWSMVPTYLRRVLAELKRVLNANVVLLGDQYQRQPIENLEKEVLCFDHSEAGYLTNGHAVRLTEQYRMTPALTAVVKTILTTGEISTQELRQTVHTGLDSYQVCRSHARRMQLNYILNVANSKHQEEHVVAPPIKSNINTQELCVYEGMPMMASTTKYEVSTEVEADPASTKKIKTKVVLNGQRWRVVTVTDNGAVELEHMGSSSEDDPKYENYYVPLAELQGVFWADHCQTVARLQGDTLHKRINVRESHMMDRSDRYVAVSRGTDARDVHVVPSKQVDEDNVAVERFMRELSLDESERQEAWRLYTDISGKRAEIRRRLNGYKLMDRNRWNLRWPDERYDSVDDIYHKLEACGYACHWCKKFCIWAEPGKYDPLMWTLDAMKPELGHIKGNWRCACLDCNKRRRNKKYRVSG
eukprot:jgi/Chrzof1/14280/Cz08g31320.t1